MNYLLTGTETERLSFRPVQDILFEEWLPFFDNQNNPRMVGLDYLPTPEEQCSMWFERGLNRIAEGRGGMNALYEKESGLFVGQCGLLVQEVDGKRELEVGYSLLPAFWGRGYATEAARKARDIAFASGFTDSLISVIHEENEPSKQVALRNDMQLHHKTIFKDLMPVEIFRIDREQWQALQ
ncbi:GNAT family N-acetyltransferase [Rurimicrobium arvi]|uniref:GNAT family N-acetyltransferase n=1 Tax=Rurimicrobium arvi TaxID=2049916 RepID=A0ABP8MX75_9BACT